MFFTYFQKSKKWPKMTKNYVCCTPCLSKHTSYDCFLLHKFKMMTSPDAFHFFKILFFWIVRGVEGKGQKMAQNEKKVLSNSVSQELYFIWLWLLVHMCKMMISPAIVLFSFFSKFWFFKFFKVHQWMPKGNSELCPAFFTFVWFLVYSIVSTFNYKLVNCK